MTDDLFDVADLGGLQQQLDALERELDEALLSLNPSRVVASAIVEAIQAQVCGGGEQ
jgi:hypothetical protein